MGREAGGQRVSSCPLRGRLSGSALSVQVPRSDGYPGPLAHASLARRLPPAARLEAPSLARAPRSRAADPPPRASLPRSRLPPARALAPPARPARGPPGAWGAPWGRSPRNRASCALHRLEAHRRADAGLDLVEHRLDVLRAFALRVVCEDGNAFAGSLRELGALANHLPQQEVRIVLFQRLPRLLGDLVRGVVGVDHDEDVIEHVLEALLEPLYPLEPPL